MAQEDAETHLSRLLSHRSLRLHQPLGRVPDPSCPLTTPFSLISVANYRRFSEQIRASHNSPRPELNVE
jgi:hypothetical protein